MIASRGLVLLALLACACGKRGAPQPPLPRGPFPAAGVSARQIGERVEVRFSAPLRRSAQPAAEPVRAELWRVDFPAGSPAPAPSADAFRRRGTQVASLEAPLQAGRRYVLADGGVAALPQQGKGMTLRYAVRVRDRRGRISDLAAAADLIPETAVPPPSGLRAEPTVDGVRLAWDPPPGTAEVHYNVYRAVGDGELAEQPLNSAPLLATDYLDSSAEVGHSYRYEVRVALAAAAPHRESASSAPVRVDAVDRFAPATPTGLIAVQEGAAIRLFWDPGRETDLGGYRLYRALDAGPWERVGPDPIHQPLFLDAAPVVGERRAYRVSAVDRSSPPNESAPSETVEVEVGPS